MPLRIKIIKEAKMDSGCPDVGLCHPDSDLIRMLTLIVLWRGEGGGEERPCLSNSSITKKCT